MRPKQQRVQEMTLKYNQSMAEVRAMQQEVAGIKANLQVMEADLQKTRDFIESLRTQKDQCEKRL